MTYTVSWSVDADLEDIDEAREAVDYALERITDAPILVEDGRGNRFEVDFPSGGGVRRLDSREPLVKQGLYVEVPANAPRWYAQRWDGLRHGGFTSEAEVLEYLDRRQDKGEGWEAEFVSPRACEEQFPGVIVSMDTEAGIQRCDQCERYDGDLQAAGAIAAALRRTDPSKTYLVKFYRQTREGGPVTVATWDGTELAHGWIAGATNPWIEEDDLPINWLTHPVPRALSLLPVHGGPVSGDRPSFTRWTLTGDTLARFAESLNGAYSLAIAVDEDELKFKVNEGMWTAGRDPDEMEAVR